MQFAGVVLIKEGSTSATAENGDTVENKAQTEQQQQSEEGSSTKANVAEKEGQEKYILFSLFSCPQLFFLFFCSLFFVLLVLDCRAVFDPPFYSYIHFFSYFKTCI